MAQRDAPRLRERGTARAEAGDFAAAIGDLRAALELDPADSGAWSNLGVLLSYQGDLAGALAAHERALDCAPDDARFRVNRVVTLLRAGRLTEAWVDFEWRLRLPRPARFPLELLMPAFVGTPDLVGRTVLVTHEDGFGDTIQFSRYLPLLAAAGATVLVAVPPPLRRLLSGISGIHLLELDDVAADRWRRVDYVCPFVSLPRVFATTLATIPPVPTLAIDPTARAHWAALLPTDGLRVGLVWAGQARPWLPGFDVLDGRRSLSLATLAPLFDIPDVRFVSLQKGPEAAFARDWPVVCGPMAEVRDFADTAAIIANLDLVISVDTAVAHLAGALGKPLFMFDRFDHCWRWPSGRDDSPWYPGLRIFRQAAIGDWAPVVRAVADAVTAMRGRIRTVVSTAP